MRIFLFFLLSGFSFHCLAQTKTFIDQPYIEANGSADSLIQPDEIYLRIILSERDSKDRNSVEDLENTIISKLQAIGIDVSKNLSARDITSNFRQYFLKKKDILKSKVFILKIGSAEIAGKVFSELEQEGISNITIEKVTHSDIDRIKNLMRTKAVQAAHRNGTALVSGIGQILGPAIHISEVTISNQLYGSRQDYQEVVVTAFSVRGFSSLMSVPEKPKIEFEEIRVNVQVNVRFKL